MTTFLDPEHTSSFSVEYLGGGYEIALTVEHERNSVVVSNSAANLIVIALLREMEKQRVKVETPMTIARDKAKNYRRENRD